jgi:site-specific recombinase XerD
VNCLETPVSASENAAEILADWVQHMEVAALSSRTITERTRIVRAISRDMGVSSTRLTSDSIRVWLQAVELPTSRASYFQALVAWSRHLVRAGVRDDDPMLRVPRPRTVPGLPRPADTTALYAVLTAATQHPDTRDKVLLGAFEGLRVHEIAKVRGEDFRIAPGQLRVVGKGAREDFLPVHPWVAAAAALRPARGAWFPSPVRPGRPVHPNSVSTVISAAFARAGAVATAHQLRHWFASTLLEEGHDVRVVQELMRHRSLATTAIYTQVSPRRRQAAVESLPGPPGGIPALFAPNHARTTSDMEG